MVLCGAPDYMLLCFKWYTTRVVAAAPCEIAANSLSFNPWDNLQLITCSARDIRYWKLDADVDTLKGGSTVSKVHTICCATSYWLAIALEVQFRTAAQQNKLYCFAQQKLYFVSRKPSSTLCT